MLPLLITAASAEVFAPAALASTNDEVWAAYQSYEKDMNVCGYNQHGHWVCTPWERPTYLLYGSSRGQAGSWFHGTVAVHGGSGGVPADAVLVS
jgi:hypothetical protein